MAQEISKEVAETVKEAAKEATSDLADKLTARGYSIYSAMKSAGFTDGEIESEIDRLNNHSSESHNGQFKKWLINLSIRTKLEMKLEIL